MNQTVLLKPPAHGRIANWLGPEMLQRLLNFAQTQRDSFSPGCFAKTSVVDLTEPRADKITELGNLKNNLKKDLRARIEAALPAMIKQLGAAAFKPGRIEVQMAAYGDGAVSHEHVDTTVDEGDEGRKLVADRIISAVYYFHRLPKAFSGGALRIYPIVSSKYSKSFVEIEPTNDTLVFFPSWFPHQVLPVICPSGRFEDSRFTITYWVNRAQ
jgi:SM-20-related protein